ncbi:hypothetical protein C1646_746231 [Rhizophagus diaphanus]|nr:hypothetical protein C1646_746231 [Rhizophagus diaphanus] [Rhizophagus sp. MUCL 43196]
MNYFPKYDGNIHPDEWINNIQKYYSLWPNKVGLAFIEVAKLLVDTTIIKLPAEINDLEKLRDIYASDSEFNSNVLWKIIKNKSPDNNYSCTTKTDVRLQHKISGQLLGISYYYNHGYHYYKSPSSDHTEVSCGGDDDYTWNFKLSKLENYEGYVKSNDIVNLSIKKSYNTKGRTQDGQVEYLRCHDVQFTIGNDTFQEVVCHNEKLGIEEWCIELIRQAN